MALYYEVCACILYDHPAISFGDRTGQSLQRHCRDRRETVQSSCNPHDLHKNHTMPVRCPCKSHTIISRVYDQFWAQMTILNRAACSRSACDARTGIVRSTCDVSTGYDFAIFQNLSLVRS